MCANCSEGEGATTDRGNRESRDNKDN
ncbi:hypothetical protein EYZ11_013099 [Aspergillus tanneri]|uniref:Uncharacterized protein n=1 Tax=Aspergillus tanneri TaxID=1220188 RepID=A0A4S3IYI8_9EURO|nr:hypothetical protein EYZ11_013099 [Aspergillus tanneri]